MTQISVNTELCRKDGACIAVCPSRSLRFDEHGFPEKAANGCIYCGHCVSACPTGALAHDGLPQEPQLAVPADLPGAEAIDGFLMSRRSVREFQEKAIERTTIESLLDVARRAPTATNSQKLHWIVVSDAAKVHALSEETIRWMQAAGIGPGLVQQWENGYDPILRAAPVVIMACTPTEYEWGKQDCAVALTFLELAAEARGLGVCWAGFLTRVAGVHAPLRKALQVPSWHVVHGGLMLGERKYAYRTIPPRKPLSAQWV